MIKLEIVGKITTGYYNELEGVCSIFINEEAEQKYAAIEKKFSDTEKRFNAKMLATSDSIKLI